MKPRIWQALRSLRTHIRSIKKEDTGPKDKVVIFGHTPTNRYLGNEKPFTIWKNGNVIGIDCGLAKISAYQEKCQLACLCLDTMTEIYG